MEEEHEMCQNCKRDIPLSNYRTHVLHCSRNLTVCPDCGDSVSRADLAEHKQQAHSLRVCDQCGVRVEAKKMHDHRTALCPMLLLVCKFCQADKPASEMSEHESACGSQVQQCGSCGSWVPLREFETHLSQRHGVIVQKSPGRQRRRSSTSGAVPPPAPLRKAPTADTSSLLPCEFCEGLVPIHKLLEHQAECVNPTNVRGSASLCNSASVTSFHNTANGAGGALLRQSASSATNASATSGQIPCEVCGQLFSLDAIQRHQLSCTSNAPAPTSTGSGSAYSSYLRPNRSSYNSLSRTSSAREARATTEERALSGIYRQSSFNERSSSCYGRSRRAESLSRQSSFSRTRYTSSVYGNPDYSTSSASRRGSYFDGYSSFAMYSSINQGLDGGRYSRRGSVTAEPTAVALAAATAAPVSYSRQGSHNASDANGQNAADAPKAADNQSSRATESEASSQAISRQNSNAQSVRQKEPMKKQKEDEDKGKEKEKSKLRRKVSFTEKGPLVIEGDKKEDGEEGDGEEEPTRKPRRKKDKERKERKKSKKRDKSADVAPQEVRRKSQVLGGELFEQVSSKLKNIELEQNKEASQTDASPQQPQLSKTTIRLQSPDSPDVPPKMPPVSSFNDPDPAFGGESSCSSSKGVTSSEASPLQKPKHRSLFSGAGDHCAAASLDLETEEPGAFLTEQKAPAPEETTQNDLGCIRRRSLVAGPLSTSASSSSGAAAGGVERRSTEAGSSSRTGSKRNSLDGKSVQALAQDLAAECAKAYALMESSLSKLSTEFSGPFGLAQRNKKTRKPRQ